MLSNQKSDQFVLRVKANTRPLLKSCAVCKECHPLSRFRSGNQLFNTQSSEAEEQPGLDACQHGL